MNTAKLKGRWGEALAADFLRKKKYTITAMNYTTRYGEIDLIAENKKYVVFVEVKTRKDDHFAEAREFVGPQKQRRLIAAASLWSTTYTGNKPFRFDVIEIYAKDGMETKNPVINHIEDAFQVN